VATSSHNLPANCHLIVVFLLSATSRCSSFIAAYAATAPLLPTTFPNHIIWDHLSMWQQISSSCRYISLQHTLMTGAMVDCCLCFLFLQILSHTPSECQTPPASWHHQLPEHDCMIFKNNGNFLHPALMQVSSLIVDYVSWFLQTMCQSPSASGCQLLLPEYDHCQCGNWGKFLLQFFMLQSKKTATPPQLQNPQTQLWCPHHVWCANAIAKVAAWGSMMKNAMAW